MASQDSQEDATSYKINKRPKDDQSDEEKQTADQKSATKGKKKKNFKPKLINVEFPVDVFLRLRPLIKHEIEEKHKEIDYSTKLTKKTKTKNFILPIKQKGRDREFTFKGLRDVILPKDKNMDVFKMAILPCIDALFAGTPCAAFAYGHSGSGKTHTMFGYEEEAGLHRLFANECLKRLESLDKKNLFLEVRLVELYQNKFYDLMSESAEKDSNEIKLLQSKANKFIFRTQPTLCDDGKYRRYPITTVRINNADELEQAISKGVASRTVGDSTVHDQSSRSHAFLEYEIVNDALKKKRKELMEMEADLLWHQMVFDQVKKKVEPEEKSKEFKEAYAKYKGDTWGLQQKIDRFGAKIEKILAVQLPKIEKSDPALSKTMVFVDLAGNEFGKDAAKDETKQEMNERIQINSDLMALKECIRALHGKNRSHIPYRMSNVTKYLKPYLGEEDSKAVMISTIGISKQMELQTLNTLKYTGLVANV